MLLTTSGWLFEHSWYAEAAVLSWLRASLTYLDGHNCSDCSACSDAGLHGDMSRWPFSARRVCSCHVTTSALFANGAQWKLPCSQRRVTTPTKRLCSKGQFCGKRPFSSKILRNPIEGTFPNWINVGLMWVINPILRFWTSPKRNPGFFKGNFHIGTVQWGCLTLGGWDWVYHIIIH